MKYIVESNIKKLCHANKKRVARETLELLDRMIEKIVNKGCSSTGSFKTVIPENIPFVESCFK
jgi:hypothetical protein